MLNVEKRDFFFQEGIKTYGAENLCQEAEKYCI